MGPFQLWEEPWEGLPEEDEAWGWELIDEVEDRRSRFPPGYKRWYLTYRTPSGRRVRISADRNPRDGRWFNPHPLIDPVR